MSNKVALGVLLATVLVSEVVLLRQNLDLKKKVELGAGQAAAFRASMERAIQEAQLQGRCAPAFETRNTATSAATGAVVAPGPKLDVALYFSIEGDCLSCIGRQITNFNELLASPQRDAVTIRGYTEIEGERSQRTLDRDLKPGFPVQHVEGLKDRLAQMGVRKIPVVVVSDPATGRVLFARILENTEEDERFALDRIHTMLTRCDV